MFGSQAAFALCLFLLVHYGLCSSFKSVSDLETAMYQVLESTPCVRLLNLTGEVGCSNPGRDKVIAPIQHFMDVTTSLPQPVSVLLPSSRLHEFLSRVLKEKLLADKVAGVLVEFEDKAIASTPTNGFSADTTYPQAEFSLHDTSYVWNPTGSGFAKNFYGFPMFLLSNSSTYLAREAAAKNGKSNPAQPLHVAEFDLVMQTTKAGTSTSESCLQGSACLPLGGYSVLSSLPPINVSAASDKDIVLVMTSMDSMSLFRDSTPGADSPLSGMIALLAAVDALVRGISLDALNIQLVFLVLAGEPWGYLGSRRFIAELSNGGSSVAGLNASRISQVIEVGSVGRASQTGSTTLYAHKGSAETRKETAALKAILDALRTSSAMSGDYKVEVKDANRSNPGLPPSSLISFANKAGMSFASVLLEEFDSAYMNPLYHSHFDTEDTIHTAAIVGSASLLARTLYALGLGQAVDLATIPKLDINQTLVEELIGCLFKGVDCSLGEGFKASTLKHPSHYVGVMIGNPAVDPLPEFVSETSQLVWNFFASRAFYVQHSKPGAAEEKNQEHCSRSCSKPGYICVGATAQRTGVCLLSTTRYVPAYSPRLRYENAGWKLVPAQADDHLSAIDPVWTESFWRTTGLQIYLQDSDSFNQFLLLSGFFLSAVSYLTIAGTKTVFRKRLKKA